MTTPELLARLSATQRQLGLVKEELERRLEHDPAYRIVTMHAQMAYHHNVYAGAAFEIRTRETLSVSESG